MAMRMISMSCGLTIVYGSNDAFPGVVDRPVRALPLRSSSCGRCPGVSRSLRIVDMAVAEFALLVLVFVPS